MARRTQAARSATPSPGVAHGEYVMYPGTPREVYDLLERLSEAAGGSPDFGTPGVSLDRTRLTVRWFGALPAAVQRVVDSAGGDLLVQVQATEFRPGELRAEAERLARDHATVVVAATARPEGDGIDVLVPRAVAEEAGGAGRALVGVGSTYPLFAEVGEAAPAQPRTTPLSR
jgi:hypothetical protein